MSNHAKIVLWLGLIMILAGVARNWSYFSSTLFGASGASYTPGRSGGKSGLATTKPGSNGQCPAGYLNVNGTCVKVNAD